jgi:hypothetical protein
VPGADPGALPAALRPTLFVKLEDVAADGTVTLPHRLIAPIRPAHLDQPVTVTLPGIVHRFAAGHRIRLVVAGSDGAYRGSATPAPIEIATDPQHPGTLTLPIAGAEGQQEVHAAALGAQACASRRGVMLHVKRAFRPRLLGATVFVGGRRATTLRRGRTAAPLTFRGLPQGSVVVRVVMRLRGGRTAVDVRRYRLCTRR